MKNSATIFPAILLFFLSACSVSTGTFSDPVNGINYNYNGVSVGSCGYYSDDKKLEKNEIPYENKISFVMKDIKGFKENDGKIFLLTTIKVKDKDGKVMLENNDLFKELNDAGGLDAEDVKSSLSLSVTTGAPLKINSTYTAEFSIKDKNGKGEINGTFQFNTTKIPGSTYTENGITSDGPMFMTKPGNKVLSDNKIGNAEKIYCYFKNTEGLVSQNGMVFPDASVVLKDGTGKVLLDFPDLFKDYPDGVSEKDMNDVFDLSFTIEELQKGKNYTVEYNLKDKKGTGSMSASLSFTW